MIPVGKEMSEIPAWNLSLLSYAILNVLLRKDKNERKK
jgi:hypothetical protein